jgi:hypothetical protein
MRSKRALNFSTLGIIRIPGPRGPLRDEQSGNVLSLTNSEERGGQENRCHGTSFADVPLETIARCTALFEVAECHKQTRKLTREFVWLGELAEIATCGQRIVLGHYALRVWNQSSRGAWQLYGHSHGKLPEITSSPSMDVV